VTDRKEEIKRTVDCRDLADHLGVEITRRHGREFQARCPNGHAHKHGDKNPSMTIRADRFTCWASTCGERGDCFALVQLVRGCDFRDALRYLADWTGVGLDGGHRTPPAPAGKTGAGQRRTEPKKPEPIPEARAETMARIWEAVEPLDLTDEAVDWLAGRGIRPKVAHALGCRDWRPAFGRIKAILARLESVEAKQQAGVYNLEGRPWWPLAESMQDNPRAFGLCVPVFDGEHKAPMAWRWRLYNPGKLKTMAQPGAGIPPLLGLHVPLSDGALKAVESAPVVVVCEGEPDWLSLHDAAEGKAAVLGLCAMATPWQADWTRHLDKARLVVFMCHDDHGGGEKKFSELYRSAVARWNKAEADKRLVRYLVDGGDDCNDMHKRGELAGVLDGLLAHLGRE